jgi:FecR protein
MLLAMATGEALAAAARADFVYGNVTVAGLDGREQPLLRGAELNNGDTVRTAEGRAQLRFTDGAYVSLQPQSEFAIRDYRFDGRTDGTERGFFGLLKGAMRAVTGLVGRVNRDQYQVTTPTATIGIRGTGGVIQVRDDGSTLIVGTSGIWSLTNPAGSIEVPAGVSALAPSPPDAPPQRTSEAPQAGPAPLILPVAYMEGEQRDANGNLTTITKATIETPTPPPPALTPVSGLAAAFIYGVGSATVGFDTDTGGTIGAFNASGQLMSADIGGSLYRLEPGGTHADFGTDGILTWGRWIGPVRLPNGTTELYSADQGFHYVVGLPTPVLPTNGVTATYALAGASRPTYLDGSTAPGTFTGSLTVTFNAQASINGQFQAAMPDRTFAWTAAGTTSSSSFSLATQTSTGCVGACTITTAGFFAGANAQGAGVGYSIEDTKTVTGAAAFRRQ